MENSKLENSKYKTLIENVNVEMEQMAIIHIPATLHSDDANHVVTTTDEIYDIELKIRQSELNSNISGDISNILNDIEAIKLDIAAAGGDINAIKEILSKYLTKEAAEIRFNEIYTKINEIETHLNNNFYTKTEVDDKFLELEINKILDNVTTTLSVSPSSEIETGINRSITVSFKVNDFTLDNISDFRLVLKKNNEVVESKNGTLSITYNDVISTQTTYQAVAIYKNNERTWDSSVTKKTYHRTYHGFAETVDEVFGYNSKVVSSAKALYADTSTKDNVYYWILVPDGVVCPTVFTMNATPFVMNESTYIKNNITYTVFKSGSQFGIGGEVNINAQ